MKHYGVDGVVVSFSGGKDSTVLLHMARQIYPEIRAVFSNTGLEYPEIQKHVKSFDNVDIVVPSMRFDNVLTTYGYPLIGKEVAEAIYYARRIRTDSSQSVNVERERETVPSPSASPQAARQKHPLIETSTARNRRTVLMGEMPAGGSREVLHQRERSFGVRSAIRLEAARTQGGDHPQCWKPSGAESSLGEQRQNPEWWNYKPKERRRHELRGFRVGVAQTGQTGEGGVFSNPEQQFGAKSQFNKEKWLPLVYTPFLISHYCCFKMKKSPMKKYQHEHGYVPMMATLAEESRVRKQAWIRHGCNAFESKDPKSQPLSFWTEQDILAYIVKYDLPIASVYGEIVSEIDGTEYPAKDLMGNVGKNLHCTGCQRTGCIFCPFGFHLEKKGETRFQRLARTHPRQYEFTMGGGQWVDNPYYDATAPEYDGDWKNWNPKQIWVPSKKGLGMRFVFDEVNQIYGKNFYRYE